MTKRTLKGILSGISAVLIIANLFQEDINVKYFLISTALTLTLIESIILNIKNNV